jgi:2-dehydropantoate 2-reductase
MRIGVVGVGAIGGFMAARLARAGQTVTLVDVGRTQDVLRERGLVLVTSDGVQLSATGATVRDLHDAGPQDLIVLAVKAYDLPAVAADLPRLCHEETVILPLQNGMPWWYFQKHTEPWKGRRITNLDPDGSLERNIPAERILGSVVYPAAEVIEPGVIRHVEGSRIVVGELDDRETDRAKTIIELLNQAGFKSFFLQDLRGEVWLKLLGSAVLNPVSALTRATMMEICQFPPSHDLVLALMKEVEAVANAFGVTMRLPIEHRLLGAEKVGDHKTSTLQDREAGLRLEVDALVGAVVEVAHWVNVPTPRLEAVEGIVRLLDKTNRTGREER